MVLRRVASRLVRFVAGIVYEWGVKLYRLEDWLDPDDDPPPQSVQNFRVSDNVTHTWSDSASVTWRQSS